MRKKGFTLIELLVVIAIIAMLLAILMPALNKVKKIAQRVVCGTNLKGLGTAMIVYGNDYDDEAPQQGGRSTITWGTETDQWRNKLQTFPAGVTKNLTIGASLYLLVREADVSPKSFVCPSSNQSEFDGQTGITADPPDIVELFDFGTLDAAVGGGPDSGPRNHQSYAYQMPYGPGGGGSTFAAGFATNSAAFAIMADRNPWMDSQLRTEVAGSVTADNGADVVCQLLAYWIPTATISKPQIQGANSQPHSREGQNVMHADGHSSFEKTADIGAKNDNIYTPSTGATASEVAWRQGNYNLMSGIAIGNIAVQPQGSNDSLLMNDDVNQ
jgi:prepilin-type N-terminal cleavage/methylation domain-containing protein